MKDAFALTTDLGDVLGASWSDKLLGFFDTPVELAKSPARL